MKKKSEKIFIMLLLAIILLISSVSIKIGAIVIGMIGLMELLTE